MTKNNNDFEIIFKRIKTGLGIKTQAELAQVLKISQPAISDAKDRGVFPLAWITKLSQAYNRSADWLLSGEGERQDHIAQTGDTQLEPAGFCLLPMMGFAGASKGGRAPENHVETKLAFREDWIRRKGTLGKTVVLQIDGDSMSPTLSDGDIVVVDQGKNFLNLQGGIYAVSIDDHIFVKRVIPETKEKKIMVISDNKNYPVKLYEQSELVIHGKVIWFGREMK